MEAKVNKTEEEWREELAPDRYEVLRQKGTEPPFTGAYTHSKETGMYRCGACGNELFSSDTKFDSGTGWPSFTEPAWRRLRAIPGIGPWTIECLAYHGQGRDDQLPAGDLAYIKLVGRLRAMGRRATEDEVREFFEPYAPFAALAGTYLVYGAYTGAYEFRDR